MKVGDIVKKKDGKPFTGGKYEARIESVNSLGGLVWLSNKRCIEKRQLVIYKER